MRRFTSPRVLLPLRHRDFRLLLAGQTVSNFGNTFFLIALPFQLLALGASPLELGIAVTVSSVSMLVFVILGGAVADRVSRRRLILTCDAAGAIATAALAVLAATGQLRIEHMYAASALLGAAFAFLFPAYSAVIAELVPADLLTEANAARTLGMAIARTAGPIAAGIVVAFSGTPLAFGIDALTFALSLVLFLAAAPTAVPEGAAEPLLRQVREGFGFVVATPWLLATLIALTFINISYAGQPGVMTPLFVRDSLHAGAATFGLVTAAFGVGRFVGGIAIPQIPVSRRGAAMCACEAIGGLATVAIGLVAWLPVTLLGMAMIGVALTSSDTLFNAAIQKNVPQRLLGRVTSINFFIGSLFFPISPIIAGTLVDVVGPGSAFVVAGFWAFLLAGVLFSVSSVRALR